MVCVAYIGCRLAPPNYPRRIFIPAVVNRTYHHQLFPVACIHGRRRSCSHIRICTGADNRHNIRQSSFHAHTRRDSDWHGGHKIIGHRRHMVGIQRFGNGTGYCMYCRDFMGKNQSPEIHSTGPVFHLWGIFGFHYKQLFDIINHNQGNGQRNENTPISCIFDVFWRTCRRHQRHSNHLSIGHNTIFKIRPNSKRTKLFIKPVLESRCPI